MPAYLRRISYVARRAFRTVVRSNDSPRQIAGGVAIGVVIGFMPTMGMQMVTAAFIATLFRCSRLPAMAMVYITNPFTALPIYLFCYVVGVGLLRPFGFTLQIERVRQLIVSPEDLGLWQTIYDKLGQLFAIGAHVLLPLWLGCLVVGSLAAVVFYHATVRLVTGHRLLKAERSAKRAQRRLGRIRRKQALEKSGGREAPDEPSASE